MRVRPALSIWQSRMVCTAFLLGAFGFVVGVRASLFYLIGFAALTCLLFRPDRKSLVEPPAFVWLAAAFGLFAALSAFWSLSFAETTRQTVPVLVTILAGHIAASCVVRAPSNDLAQAAWWSMIGGVVGVGYVALEVATGQFVLKWLVNAIPFLKPESKSLYSRNGNVFFVALSFLNWSIAAMNLMVWPAIVTLVGLRIDRRWRFGLAFALWLLVAVTTFRSEHQTSMIALAGATITFFAAWSLEAQLVRRLAIAACAVIVLGTPIFASMLPRIMPEKWLPESAVARVGIWAHLASKLPEAPVIGVGVRSIRVDVKPRHAENTGQAWNPKLAVHGHNIYLQTWYELGAVGAGLLFLICLSIVHLIHRSEPFLHPFAYATFASAVLIGFSSWELWTFWFPAAFALTFLGFLVAKGGRGA